MRDPRGKRPPALRHRPRACSVEPLRRRRPSVAPVDDQHTTADERVVDPMSKSTDTQFGWRQIGARVAVLTVMIAFAAFWTWALFFASKEAVNRIGDVEWAERAEAVCQDWNER